MTSTKGPQRGSRRVAAWVYAVLNPWVDAVRHELEFLGRGATSWRFWSRELEFILPLSEYIAPAAQPTLEDFWMKREEVQGDVEAHDKVRDELRDAATAAHDELVARPEFKHEVESCLSQYLASGEQRRNPAGGFAGEPLASLVAQRVIDNIRELTEQYTDAEFWRLYGDRFGAMRTGPAFETFDLRIKEMERFDKALENKLVELRFNLIDEYDIAPAPLR